MSSNFTFKEIAREQAGILLVKAINNKEHQVTPETEALLGEYRRKVSEEAEKRKMAQEEKARLAALEEETKRASTEKKRFTLVAPHMLAEKTYWRDESVSVYNIFDFFNQQQTTSVRTHSKAAVSSTTIAFNDVAHRPALEKATQIFLELGGDPSLIVEPKKKTFILKEPLNDGP